jgi:hypothetical protein
MKAGGDLTEPANAELLQRMWNRIIEQGRLGR